MNFLSHFYFDRHTTDCYHVLGTLLPDLFKNADKTTVLHPERLTHPDKNIMSLVGGWQKHLAVDRFFHSSAFFTHHSHQLKLELLPALQGSPVKPFFLGHIGVELILDNLLVTTNQINVDDFYKHLNNCREDVITDFLSFSGMQEPEKFITFFERFKQSQYLRTYKETPQVAYALKRICMRIWKSPFTDEQEILLSNIVLNYRTMLEPHFMEIFKEINSKLTA